MMRMSQRRRRHSVAAASLHGCISSQPGPGLQPAFAWLLALAELTSGGDCDRHLGNFVSDAGKPMIAAADKGADA